MTDIPRFSNTTQVEAGSFRDRNGRVFYNEGVVFRGISQEVLDNWKTLSSTNFFRASVASGKIVATEQVERSHIPDPSLLEGWAAVLKHQMIPFVSYPYEWCFGMLRDAALLQLELLDKALDENMTLKDASSFNTQWVGANPVFIDIPSFEKLIPGTPWIGYRQFCEMFLYPLMLQAYKDIPFHSWLRGKIDGIDPEEFTKLMTVRDFLRSGVFMDVYLQAKLQAKYAQANRQVKNEIRASGFRKEMIKINIHRLGKIIRGLKWKRVKSEWANYATDNSYTDADSERKAKFVREITETRRWNLIWDLGSNTGRFSRIAAAHAQYIVAMDSDHLAVERLYQELKAERNKTILPMVMNLADASPNLGWRGLERKSLVMRGKPDLILCLALIHHIVISANIPLKEFLDWLASLGGNLIIEFVTKEDPMVKFLLRNKEDQYSDYELGIFEKHLSERYEIKRREALGSGTRYLFYAEAK